MYYLKIKTISEFTFIDYNFSKTNTECNLFFGLSRKDIRQLLIVQ